MVPVVVHNPLVARDPFPSVAPDPFPPVARDPFPSVAPDPFPSVAPDPFPPVARDPFPSEARDPFPSGAREPCLHGLFPTRGIRGNHHPAIRRVRRIRDRDLANLDHPRPDSYYPILGLGPADYWARRARGCRKCRCRR